MDKPRTLASQRRREALVGYLFIAPAFILFLIFIAGPMVYSLVLSFHHWDIFSDARYAGLDNYKALVNDARAIKSFKNTAIFVAAVVPLDVGVALALAVALQHNMPTALRYFLRTTYILPIVISVAAISIVLKFMFNTQQGVINYYLGLTGIDSINWLRSTDWALRSLVITTVWKTFGFDLLLFTAGIQNIPRHLYEAAEIDGANGWQKFWSITLPQLSPTIFLVVVIGVIGHSQMFDQANIMTNGGPGGATTTIVMSIWNNLTALRLGYGSSIATVFFSAVLLLTIFQFWLSRHWVYYEGGDF
ncbi:MAG TPA: sugar ABC transporter permease [Aggregatilineales bacterium]|nr:sugar ABC transporter permease [Aggregatilineales bacterium]